jgi:hypothetical protein
MSKNPFLLGVLAVKALRVERWFPIFFCATLRFWEMFFYFLFFLGGGGQVDKYLDTFDIFFQRTLTP